MQFLKRQLPIAVAFIVGLVLWAVYYIPSSLAQDVQQSFTAWAIILSGAALILGILSAIHHHWSKVSLQKPGYGYSLITIFCFGFVVIAGWFTNEHRPWPLYASLALAVIGVFLAVTYFTRRKRGDTVSTRSNGIASLLFLALGLVGVFGIVPLQQHYFTGLTIKEGSVFDWVFQNMFVPLDATMFSLLAFYIASAAFRAFRARSFEATALLIAGCIVMIGRVPLGEQMTAPGLYVAVAIVFLILVILGVALAVGNKLTLAVVVFAVSALILLATLVYGNLAISNLPELGSDISFASVASWILNNPNAAAQRGILLGVLLSMVAISLRIIFGIERTYMGGAD
jgi:hypothetical protein